MVDVTGSRRSLEDLGLPGHGADSSQLRMDRRVAARRLGVAKQSASRACALTPARRQRPAMPSCRRNSIHVKQSRRWNCNSDRAQAARRSKSMARDQDAGSREGVPAADEVIHLRAEQGWSGSKPAAASAIAPDPCRGWGRHSLAHIRAQRDPVVPPAGTGIQYRRPEGLPGLALARAMPPGSPSRRRKYAREHNGIRSRSEKLPSRPPAGDARTVAEGKRALGEALQLQGVGSAADGIAGPGKGSSLVRTPEMQGGADGLEAACPRGIRRAACPCSRGTGSRTRTPPSCPCAGASRRRTSGRQARAAARWPWSYPGTAPQAG